MTLTVSANLDFLYIVAESLSVGPRLVDTGSGAETKADRMPELLFLPQLIDLELVSGGSSWKDNLPYAGIKEHIDDFLCATLLRIASGGIGGWGGKPLRTLRISSLSDADYERLSGVAWTVHRNTDISLAFDHALWT